MKDIRNTRASLTDPGPELYPADCLYAVGKMPCSMNDLSDSRKYGWTLFTIRAASHWLVGIIVYGGSPTRRKRAHALWWPNM